MIPPETLDAIRARLDIEELVREYVPDLKRAGRNIKGRCPFHQERTPSFIVSPERQSFHCFGCGEGGDPFAFLMKLENLSFMEAVEKLAERTGVKIEKSAEALGPAEREKLKMREALEFASDFYHGLLKGAQGGAGRHYLEQRGLTAATIDAFKLGFAPPRAGLVESAARKGFAPELLVKAGLAAPREGGGFRDYFFNRALYPIRDARGSFVGFGARTLGDAQPKYLNSPDSAAFSKGKILYGLFHGLAEVRKARRALLMEGYMDVIAAHQYGLKIACAPLGTAVTVEQATLLKRYVSEVTVVFDSDNAGLAAAVRGTEILLAQGLSVRIASVPEGKDPDEHLRNFGVESFNACLDKAVDLPEFQTELALKKFEGPLRPEQKSEVARQVLATIEKCPDEVLKSEWVRRLANRLGINEEALRRQSDKGASSAQEAARSRHRPQAAKPVKAGPLSAKEEHVLVLLLKHPELAALVQDDDFDSVSALRVAQAARAAGAADKSWSSKVLDALAAEDRTLASRLMVDDRPDAEPEATLKAIVAQRRNEARLRVLEPLMRQDAPDPAVRDEFYRLQRELRGSKTAA